MIKGLDSLSVKRDLYKEGFAWCELLQDRILTLIAGQREAIQEGIAVDTSLDGLTLNTQSNYTYHGD